LHEVALPDEPVVGHDDAEQEQDDDAQDDPGCGHEWSFQTNDGIPATTVCMAVVMATAASGDSSPPSQLMTSAPWIRQLRSGRARSACIVRGLRTSDANLRSSACTRNRRLKSSLSSSM